MPIQHAIWTVAPEPKPLPSSRLPSEQTLEEMIVREPSILSSEWMLIGRQEPTNFGGRIDLLAIAPDGSLVLIELKRDKTPRDVIAQALDYAAWVEQLATDKIAQIYQRFSGGGNLDDAFRKRFGIALEEDAVNQTHQVVVVAGELDAASERIVNYLSSRDIPVNVAFFQIFEYKGERLLSRAWLIDPSETQANAAMGTKPQTGSIDKEPWNGEFYVSFGGDEGRRWDEARRYGFVSAGGGLWYSQTLKQLSPGDRIWVNAPGIGYLGVGRVTQTVQPAKEFRVQTEIGLKPVLEVLERADRFKPDADDPQKSEYFVGVKWLDTVPVEDAVSEVGLFGNQNSVCKPTAPKWRHTVERLKSSFPNWSADA